MIRLDRSFYIPAEAIQVRIPDLPDEVAVGYIRVYPGGRASYMGFWGKQAKPYFHFSTENEAQALARLIEKLTAARGAAVRHEQTKLLNRAQQLARVEACVLQKGDLFTTSWGYGQTNVEGYMLVSRTKQTADVIRVALETVPGSEGHDCDSVRVTTRPLKENQVPIRCRIDGLTSIIIPDTNGRRASLTTPQSQHHRSWGY